MSTTLINSLKEDYPDLRFQPGPVDRWSPQNNRIDYSQPLNPNHLLHEVGHALMKHTDYRLDIELLKMEADAWVKAREIAPRYGLAINQAHINSCLETYRQWLLKRSLCPECQLAGIQDDNREYSCPNCQLRWRVPQGLGCQLPKSKPGAARTNPAKPKA